MDERIYLSNVRVAGTPTFFPHSDPNKCRCLVTVIKNRGTNGQNQQLTNEYTLVFWGKYANVGACLLDKGRAINVEAVPRTRNVDTGRTKANGKREIYRTTNWHVRSFEFGPDSMKELDARVTNNLQALKQAGLLDPNSTITAAMLLKIERSKTVDYNQQIVSQTGMYGNARVFIKGQGFVQPQSMGAPVVAAEDTTAKVEALTAELERLKKAAADQTAAASPFNAAS